MFSNNAKDKKRKSGDVDTLVGSYTSINGDVLFSGGLHVDGRIQGKVLSVEGEDASLSISDSGSVEGDVSVPNITVNGSVSGNIHSSQHMTLAGNARVTGNVYYNKLEIHPGAEVNGQMVHDPLGDRVASAEKPAAKLSRDFGELRRVQMTSSSE